MFDYIMWIHDSNNIVDMENNISLQFEMLIDKSD
jgi:hypothetical protein